MLIETVDTDGAFRKVVSKVKTPITMYQNVVIGYKMPGDVNLSHLTGTNDYIRAILGVSENHTWTGVWAEDKNMNDILTQSQFLNWFYVGSKNHIIW